MIRLAPLALPLATPAKATLINCDKPCDVATMEMK